LTEHDLDLTRNREQLKVIRRGEGKLDQLTEYFQDKEKSLEQLYLDSDLQHKPDQGKIKQLLLNCLETHYGSLDGCVNATDDQGTEAVKKLNQISLIING